MPDDFEIQIDKFVANTEKRLLEVMQRSLDDMIHDIQTPVKKGGKMRVDTGFLRVSGRASINSVPTGSIKGDRKGTYVYDNGPLLIVLAKMEIGDTFYWGWTARYAKYREITDGFLESGLQKWQGYVDDAVRHIRKG